MTALTKSSAIRLCFLCLALLFSQPRLSNATTILVMQDGSGDAMTIMGGLSLAAEGDSILVGPGVYAEQVTIDKSVTLISTNGTMATSIDASGFACCVCSLTEEVTLRLEGFTLQGAEPDSKDDIAFAVNGRGDVSIVNCIFTEGTGNMSAMFWEGNARLTFCGAAELGPASLAHFYVNGASMIVSACEFHHLEGHVVVNTGGACVIDTSVFAHIAGPYAAIAGVFDVQVEDCVFRDLDQVAVGPFRPPVAGNVLKRVAPYEIRGCTFSKVRWGPVETSPQNPLMVFESNLVTGGDIGVGNTEEVGAMFACNNVWGNLVNWSGMPDPTGQDGNISAPPLYCDAESGNLQVASNSPCLPANNTCGLLIGAQGQGCGPSPVEQKSWGAIKGLYRE